MSAVIGNPLLLSPEGYQISRSVRLRSSASAYFSRTLGSGNTKKWFWSGWVKRGRLGAQQPIFGAAPTSTQYTVLQFTANDQLSLEMYQTTLTLQMITSAVYRDPSAWYHIAMQYDSAQATNTNRFTLWVNGQQVTAFSTATYPALNADTYINNAYAHGIGSLPASYTSLLLDGYLTEVNFIDGQALTPSSFGETDTITGVWKPKKYAGTYGTNGFYLNFSDNSAATAAAIGKDYSGNGNNWTPNNISLTAGVTYDSMLDVPTPWADGGNGRGNYAVINPLDFSGAAGTLSEGNLSLSNSASGARRATMGMTNEKIYWEIIQSSTVNASNPISYGAFGLTGAVSQSSTAQSVLAYTDNGSNKAFWRTTTAGIVQTVTPSSFTMSPGDVLQVAYDGVTGKLWFGKNGTTWYDGSGGTTGDPSTGANPVFTLPDLTNPMGPGFSHAGVAYTARLNCGQRPFAYTPPTGFKALNTQNLPDATIKKGGSYFNAVTYAGNNSSKVITGLGFQPDLLWFKARATAYSHALIDSVRGRSKVLQPNLTSAEATTTSASNDVVSFDADGFTLGPAEISSSINNDTSIVSWAWKKGATPGFDIVTFTGTGAAQNIAHSLGVAPRMMIVKPRSMAGSWAVYHASIGAGNAVWLNLTDASASYPTVWNSTAPTSSQFTVGSFTNNGATFVADLFAEVAGFSKFGSYTGNGSTDGPFVYCGFRPRWILIKNISVAGDNWQIFDTARDTFNAAKNLLQPNASNAEGVTGSNGFDMTANGFKIRDTGGYANRVNENYIFAAFAENPLKHALAR